jgi:LytS/YehU family sensor histidine kinase
MMSYLLLLGYFYVNYYLGVPQLYFKKKYVVFGLFSLLFLVLVTTVPALFMLLGWGNVPSPHPGPPGGGPDILPGFRPTLMLFLLVFVVSLMLRINARWKQAERERMTAELAHLKAQINPHFLFNTLNSIYSLAVEKSDETANAVVRLSGMMRYAISESDKDLVALHKEIKYVEDYIDLQKLRLGSTVNIDFRFDGDAAGKLIAPLILMPFVENAFKHGVNPEEDSSLTIHINVNENQLEMEVRNFILKDMQRNEHSSGLGIQNTKNRLMHLYPSRHLLDIRETEKEFIVQLKIDLL